MGYWPTCGGVTRRLRSVAAFYRGYRRRGVHYVCHGRNWVIRWIGEAIQEQMRRRTPPVPYALSQEVQYLYCQVVHFGSIWQFVRHVEHTHRSNRVLVTFYHGSEDADAEMQRAYHALRENMPRVDGVVTASRIMESQLLAAGIPHEKLHLIPLGVDVGRFHPPSPERRRELRRRLGIPDDAITIGSFQKDGIGWEDGNEPKLTKGPDVFLEAMAILAGQHENLMVLLTGPARGYVKSGLDKLGIPYRHDVVDNYLDIVRHYQVLDLYVIASRCEGGPLALLESWGTGVPLVSTRVGMAADLVRHRENGMLAEPEDAAALASHAADILENEALRKRCRDHALKEVQRFDWPLVAELYYERLYHPILAGR